MQTRHMPNVDARYWSAITFASLFGTNMGDLYAHETGLGIFAGVGVLATLAAVVFLLERRDTVPRELYYWLVIIIIRTGATNIADYLAFRVRVPQAALSIGLAVMIGIFAWLADRDGARRSAAASRTGMPATGGFYWAAMLGAGVFGTVVGDVLSHIFGEGQASIGLGALLAIALIFWSRFGFNRFWVYWIAVAVARTTGTSMGDWLAENDSLDIGLPLSTCITGAIFLAILTLWPRTLRVGDRFSSVS